MSARTELEILDLASRQNGVLSASQLGDRGIAASTLNRRAAVGSLRRLANGLYLVPSLENPHSRLSAALLLTPVAVASHRTAARLHHMPVPAPNTVELTSPKGRSSPSSLAIVHETRYLPDVDIVVVDGLRATSPARTVCDLVTSVSERQLNNVVQKQLIKNYPSAQELVACHRALARQGRTGTVRMRAVLLRQLDDQPFPQSELELRTLEALLEHGITYLRRQFAPPWHDGVRGIVDFADPVGRTILEADGRSFHTIDQDRQRDRERDRLAARNGWLVVRVGWQEIVDRPESTMIEIGEILESRRNLAA